MGGKRKASAAASPSQNAPTPSHEPSAVAPRRSSRHVATVEEYGTRAPDKADIKQEVQNGIQGPAKMEHRLRRATKRQKLEVEKSDLGVPKGINEEGVADSLPTALDEKLVASSAKKDTRTRQKTVDRKKHDHDDCDDANEMDVEDMADEGEACAAERGAARIPAVNSSYLPLPWTGRLGYACLNTYLRSAKPPVFSSRTCRIASIIEHRHPLLDPSLPEHATKNRPDKTQDPDVGRGQRYVQELGLANARDAVKMLRWNEKYAIRFFRLSSEMFPFASHPVHGYKLAPFASEVLAEVGKVAAEQGHRLTTHPGQFTQLGSPRKEVVTAAVRDLEYHNELLSLLRLPEQQNRDAVMILHMGGVFGDKPATLGRFRQNYTTLLSPSIQARLVLENDDVSWSVHDLLPVCEELKIPLVLDYHHNNIVFDSTQVREGTLDISVPALAERIAATWRRKGITQKMHYSEPCAGATTPRDRRKHSPRVATLPPCPPGVDLMIEAKDKEQAVFELMRTFKLPGFERINDMVPHEREDETRSATKVSKKKAKKSKVKKTGNGGKGTEPEESDQPEPESSKAIEVSAADFAMGGPMNRVYWPPGMAEWLAPKKRDKVAKVEVKDEVKDEADGEEDEG